MELKFIVESILFSAQKPMSPKEIREVLKEAVQHDGAGGAADFKKTPVDNIISALEDLARDHETSGRSYRLISVAGAWQFVSQTEYAPWIKALVGHRCRPSRLSQPALETLAIIAYRQPLTRSEIEQVRGVAVDGVMATLVERGLVEQVGRADVPGRPMTYATTGQFLEYFGLGGLEDLPAADELRRVPVTRPESLLTVDPGLATAPPGTLNGDEDGPGPQAESPSGPTEDADEPGTASADSAAASSEAMASATATRTVSEPQPAER
jgi:segregation and condensation protein B